MKRRARTTIAGRCRWCGRGRRLALQSVPSPRSGRESYRAIKRPKPLTQSLSLWGREQNESAPEPSVKAQAYSDAPTIKRPNARETSMTRADLTEKILDIKREKEWSWKYIHEKIGGTSPVLLVGALLGHMKLTKPQAANAAELFGLSKA